MDMAQKKETIYSYADYLTWNDNERWELLEGVPYNLSSPSDIHQAISGNIFALWHNYLKGKSCRVYYAPFDVILSEGNCKDEEIFDVLQPDIIIVCDKNKISRKGCTGAPDIVIEILSPSTASKDCIKKKDIYEKNRVPQYWIIDPDDEELFIFKLNRNFIYGRPEKYKKEDIIKVETFEGLEINVKEIFQY
jgi:Uma2 family endonuclease